MPYRKISEDLKACALRLLDLGWDKTDICELLEVSPVSLQRWVSLYYTTGSFDGPAQVAHGPSRTLTRAVLQDIHILLRAHPDTYLDELVWWLGLHHGITISKTSLHTNLAQVGLTHKRLQKIAAERNEEVRTQWKEMRATHSDVFVRGDRYSLAAAMTKDGYIATRVVPGSFDAEKFYDFIVDDVLPQMGQWPAEARSVIVLDNCRIHH
ncbi:hypothetical protein K466DRAFT_645520, partial [Polyporus arcularius HHB13444]